MVTPPKWSDTLKQFVSVIIQKLIPNGWRGFKINRDKKLVSILLIGPTISTTYGISQNFTAIFLQVWKYSIFKKSLAMLS